MSPNSGFRPRCGPVRRRSSGAAVIVGLLAAAGLVAVAGCESPTLPRGRDFGYEFRLLLPSEQGTDSLVFHWDPGTAVPVFVQEPQAEGRPSLREAFEEGRTLWNRAAVFAEVRLEETSDLSEARVVLRWADTPSPVQPPPQCGGPVIGGAARTVGCVSRDAVPHRLARWARVDGGFSDVRMEVTLTPRDDADAGRVRRLVRHELGHVVGIMAHSQDPGDLMFGGALSTDTLTGADRATLSIVYQSRRDLFP